VNGGKIGVGARRYNRARAAAGGHSSAQSSRMKPVEPGDAIVGGSRRGSPIVDDTESAGAPPQPTNLNQGSTPLLVPLQIQRICSRTCF
jgi:hypothetical protein